MSFLKISSHLKTNWKASWTRGLPILVGVFLTGAVACQKGGGGGDAAAPVPFPPGGFYNPMASPGCAGCPGNGGFLAAAIARAPDMLQGPIELGLAFFGDPSILGMGQGYPMGGYQQGYLSMYPQGSYRGPVSVQGFLTLPMGLPACALPPGRFTLQTIQPGIWGNDGAGRSAEGLVLAMVGAPIQVTLFLSGYTVPSSGQVMDQTGNRYPFTFTTTTAVVKRADGPYCQLYLM